MQYSLTIQLVCRRPLCQCTVSHYVIQIHVLLLDNDIHKLCGYVVLAGPLQKVCVCTYQSFSNSTPYISGP